MITKEEIERWMELERELDILKEYRKHYPSVIDFILA